MDKLLQFLGLIHRANRLVLGGAETREAIAAGRVRLAVLARDAGRDTEKHIRRACEATDIPLVALTQDKAQLGAALGLQSCAVCAITDKGFAQAFLQKREAAEKGNEL